MAGLVVVAAGWDEIPTVSDMGELMAVKLVDDLTDSHSDKTRESWGSGCCQTRTAPSWLAMMMVTSDVAAARKRIPQAITLASASSACVDTGPGCASLSPRVVMRLSSVTLARTIAADATVTTPTVSLSILGDVRSAATGIATTAKWTMSR